MADIKTVGVVGAGQMGSGIAHVCALAGYEVAFHDVSRERIDAGIETVTRNLSRQVSRGIVAMEHMQSALGRIKPSEALEAVGASDLIIEAATENEEVKKAIFKSLAPHLGEQTLLASNTSSISITRLASTTDRPERFIGLHFMNPVPLMKLVEIIRGIATDVDTYETAATFAKSLGKTTANAEDFPAFIVNRVLVPMINEAIYTPLRRRRHGGEHRHRHEARRQPSHGALGARRLHRPRHRPRHHERALRGACGFQIPSVPLAGEVCGGGLARQEGRPRLLRLPGRTPGADPLTFQL